MTARAVKTAARRTTAAADKSPGRRTAASGKGAARRTGAAEPARAAARRPAASVPDQNRQNRRAAAQLVECLEGRGLLDQDEVRRLKVQAEEMNDAQPGPALQKLTAFTRRVAGCLEEGPRLTEALRTRRLEALFEINRQIAQIIDPTECLERLLALVGRVIAYEGATLFLTESENGRLRVAATAGEPIDLIDRIEFDHGHGFSGWVARTQKPILFGSLKKSQPTHRGVIKSFMAAPIVVAGRTVAVLTLGHSQEGFFQRDDLRLLVLIGSQAAALVQKVVMEERLRQVSITDELTGLYNRAHFLTRLQEEANRAARFLQEFAVVTLDVDGFGGYNEAVGRETGDRALAELSAVLTGMARSTDLVARLEGDRFALLLPMTSRAEARAAADRFVRAVEAHVFPRRKRLGVLAGVAVFPDDAAEPQELLSLADKALDMARREVRERLAELPAAAA